MRKYLICLLTIIACSGCSIVSKQYYYVPSTAHQVIKSRSGYFKMQQQQIDIADSSGKPIGAINTSNGSGVPLLAGPPYLPVLPVGLVTVFYKGVEQFEMDINVSPVEGYFLTLAIDSESYKKTRDSLNALRIMTARPLKTSACYMIVNGSTKVPLRVTEYFMGSTKSHSYRLSADIRFGRVRRVTIITGNLMLDSALKNISFKRNSRLIYSVLGLS